MLSYRRQRAQLTSMLSAGRNYRILFKLMITHKLQPSTVHSPSVLSGGMLMYLAEKTVFVSHSCVSCFWCSSVCVCVFMCAFLIHCFTQLKMAHWSAMTIWCFTSVCHVCYFTDPGQGSAEGLMSTQFIDLLCHWQTSREGGCGGTDS